MAARLTPAEKAEQAVILAELCAPLGYRPECVSAFEEGGGVVRYLGPAEGWRAKACGFASTCTASAAGAVMNWCRNVRIRTAK